MFAEVDPNAPWWMGLGMGILSIGWGILKLYDHFKGKKLGWSKADDERAGQKKKELTEEQKEARRNAAIEAVPVVERLTLEIQAQDRKIIELEKSVTEIELRERECSEERREERVIISILITWARKQKNAPPIPDEILKKFLDGNGSKTHLPVDGAKP